MPVACGRFRLDIVSIEFATFTKTSPYTGHRPPRIRNSDDLPQPSQKMYLSAVKCGW